MTRSQKDGTYWPKRVAGNQLLRSLPPIAVTERVFLPSMRQSSNRSSCANKTGSRT